MLVWILRAAALLGSPALAYYLISPDSKGIMAGAACGVVLVAMEFLLESINLMTLIIGVVGAVMGIVVSKLLDYGVMQIDHYQLTELWKKFHILIQFLLALLGTILAIRKVSELDDLDEDITALGKKRGKGLKLLDMSAVIDGRIIDICDTHFLAGTLVAPRFILNELHALAESQEQLKRARGRRGLDILARLQEAKEFPFRVLDKDLPDIKDSDAKVIKLAKELGAKVVTTDFNMNKMAALREWWS